MKASPRDCHSATIAQITQTDSHAGEVKNAHQDRNKGRIVKKEYFLN